MKSVSRFKSKLFQIDVTCQEDFRSWQFTLRDNWTSCVGVTQIGKTKDRRTVYTEPQITLSFGTNTLNKDSTLTQMQHLSNFEAAARVAKKLHDRLLVFVNTPCMRVCAEQLTIELLLSAAAEPNKYNHHLYCSASRFKPIGSAGCSCKSIELWLEEQKAAVPDETQI